MEPTIHQLERRERRGRRLPALAILTGAMFITATWLGLFTFLAGNSGYGTFQDLDAHYICSVDDLNLDFPDLSRLSEVYTSDGVLLGLLTERNSQPLPLEDMPDTIVEAVLSAEDAGFFDHQGIDFRAIFRAAIFDATGGGRQGGSTITQQVVKQNFLSNTEQTIERKLCEAVVAAELERRYTKDQILEFYMNSVYYGSNAYGIKAAADEYFGKDLDELSVAEAAAVVIPIRAPTTYDLRSGDPDVVVSRRNSVITQMEKNGYITNAQATAAKAQPLVTAPTKDFDELNPEVIIAARDELLNNTLYGLGESYSERKISLFGCPASDTDCEGGGGLKVTVTVDFAMQEEAKRILRDWFRPEYAAQAGDDQAAPTGAIAMVDNRTGAVKVMAGGLDFGEDIESGERPYDLASKGRRQAGSSFKPFALISALEKGSTDGRTITLGSYFDYSSPIEIDCGYPCSERGNIWRVSNAGGSSEGIRTLEQATYLSTNTVYAQVSLAVGPENIVETAHRMGIESPLNPVLSISLGTNAVSPLEMASAYSTIANYGIRRPSYIIERIEDASGKVIYDHEVKEERVVDEALAAAVVNTMEKVVSQGTATRANIPGLFQAGKTGTTQSFNDVWFVGYIPQYTTAVWVGDPDAQIELVNFKVFDSLNQQEQSYQRAFGGTLAAPIWKQFMLYITADLPIEDFPPDPEGTSAYYQLPTTTVPDLEGLTLAEAKTAVYQAGLSFTENRVASLEPVDTIIGQAPAAGATVAQGRAVIVDLSSGEPPALWDLFTQTEDRINDVLARFATETGVRLGWVRAETATADVSLHGKVVFTDPPAGSVVNDGDTITIYFGVPPPSG